MKKQEVIRIANQILKSNNYRFEFEEIQELPNDFLNGRDDVYSMGEENGCELCYTMAALPLNFIYEGNNLYQLF